MILRTSVTFMVIADCGLEIRNWGQSSANAVAAILPCLPNPQSAIRNPQ